MSQLRIWGPSEPQKEGATGSLGQPMRPLLLNGGSHSGHLTELCEGPRVGAVKIRKCLDAGALSA